ncbi:MAG: hypothetical protein KDD70_16605 [Bdellovibrionales bacterium]|nr:hypothetical protein [Bdellovibrionales bacterium]
MDVSEVKITKSVDSVNKTRQSSQRSASELSADKVNSTRSEAVRTESVRIDVSERGERNNKTREKANQVIGSLNIVEKTADDLTAIVNALAGITDQASDNSLSESRRQVLDNEAQDLLRAIDERSQVKTSDGARPLQGDPIELDIEEFEEKELGKALKVILPETSTEQLGLATASVSKVEQILNTRRAIENARNQLEQLRSQVDDSKVAVQKVLERVDIAAQNREASETSIRDVDAALQLTGGLAAGIGANPDEAFSAAAVAGSSIRLLSGE